MAAGHAVSQRVDFNFAATQHRNRPLAEDACRGTALEWEESLELDIDDAFAELGLTPDATDLEVKAAWRRLVSQWHPDRNGSAAAVVKMQRINRAVEAIRQSAAQGPGTSPSSSEPGDPGSARPTAAQRTARTIHRRVRLTLEEAAFGCIKELRGKIIQTCAACAGAGYRVLGGHCPECQGSGAVRDRSWFGWLGPQTECEACLGGGIARQPCGGCAGTGKAASRSYKVTVRLPHGVRNGDLLSVSGRHTEPGLPPDELSLRVEVLAHELLAVDEDGTVRCAMPVDGFAWIANRSVEVPTLGGLQTIQLQRDQLSHRLAGQGFPVERRGPRADQVITLTPVFPQRLSTDQQILLDQLIATTSGPDAGQPDDRIRDWSHALRAWKRRVPARD